MLKISDIDTSNLIIMNYPPYTGGRFIANCLSLSKHALLTDPASADHLVANPMDYEYRLATILKTLPSRSNMTQWIDYELDSIQPTNLINYEQNDLIRRMNIKKVLESGMMYFAIAHGEVNGLESVAKTWKNSKIIKLVNSRKFQTRCLELKKSVRTLSINNDITQFNGNECEEKYNMLKGVDWPAWKEFDLSGCDTSHFDLDHAVTADINQYYKWSTLTNPRFIVDIDSCVFDADSMVEEIRKLYDKLSFDDFSCDLVKQYCIPYIKLHNQQ